MDIRKKNMIDPQNLENKKAIAKALFHIHKTGEIENYLKKMILDRLLWANTENDDKGDYIKYKGQLFWTEGALKQLLANVMKNRRMRKKKQKISIYKDLRHEHSVPKDWVKKEFETIVKDISYERVYDLLVKYGQAVVLSKDEHDRLNKVYKKTMPEQPPSEPFDVFARYRKAGLKVCQVLDLDPQTITNEKIQEYLENRIL